LNRIGVEERRAGRDRNAELRRLKERQRAVEAATQLVPAAQVNSPPANAKGARVTPTQRCTADNRSGNQCGSKTARGQFCWVHMRSLEGTSIKPATVPAAGMALYAARDFARGEHIADYSGDERVLRGEQDGGAYYLGLSQRRAIDAARTNSGYGRWANDPRGSGYAANAELVLNQRKGVGRLRATRRIAKGDEIFVSYGAAYWRHHGRHAKLPVRPAAAAARPRDVIDLTPVAAEADSRAATFSADLATAFDAACKADAAYAGLVAQGPGLSNELPVRIRDGRLFRRSTGALMVPSDKALRTRLLRECHDSPATGGHLGREKTIAQMQQRFYWTGMTDEIELYVRTCEECQKNKPSQQRTPGQLMPIPPPERAGHTWTMDLITKLPKSRSGNDAIVVWVDKFTKLRHYTACKTAISAPELARLFMQTVVRMHGVPSVVISDRDPRFTAHFWKAFWASMGTTLNMSTAYHPETDGQTENANRTLETMLRATVDFAQTDWDELLAAAELAFNNAKNETTGFSPYYLFYGQQAQMPLDLAIAPLTAARDNPAAAEETARWRRALLQAKENSAAAQQRQKKYADRHRRPVAFKVGDQVLLSTEHLTLLGETKRTRKFTERFLGPYRVKRVVNANAYELELPPQLRIHPTINVSQLKEWHDGTAAFPDRPTPLTRPAPVAAEDNGAPAWEVERVLDHRRFGRRKVVQYLIEWKGYPVSEATWEPVENLDGALELVVEYNQAKAIDLGVVTALAADTPNLPQAVARVLEQWATLPAIAATQPTARAVTWASVATSAGTMGVRATRSKQQVHGNQRTTRSATRQACAQRTEHSFSKRGRM
jgi:hypothetical protein